MQNFNYYNKDNYGGFEHYGLFLELQDKKTTYFNGRTIQFSAKTES